MMKLLLGDPHVKKSNLEESQKLMNFVIDVAVSRKVDSIEILGDLFHTHAVKRLEVEDFWIKTLKEVKDEKERSYHRIERRYGSFSRSFELPTDVDASAVEATYKDGVLKLSLPKTEEQSLKKIEVKSS